MFFFNFLLLLVQIYFKELKLISLFPFHISHQMKALFPPPQWGRINGEIETFSTESLLYHFSTCSLNTFFFPAQAINKIDREHIVAQNVFQFIFYKLSCCFKNGSEEHLRSCSLSYVINLAQINFYKNFKKLKKERFAEAWQFYTHLLVDMWKPTSQNWRMKTQGHNV